MFIKDIHAVSEGVPIENILNKGLVARMNGAHMKTTGLIVVILLLNLLLPWAPAMTAEPQTGLSQRLDLPRYRMWLSDPELSELRLDIVTPHTSWARPYAGGTLKVVVIAPRWTQRATVELQQRFDFDASAVMTLFSGTWGDPNNPIYAWHKYGTEELVTERAMAALKAAQRPDVIVLGWMAGTAIPAEVQQAIADAVAKGSGLVIFNPRGPLSEKLDALVKQGKPVTGDPVNAVVDGIPTGNLPPLQSTDPRSLVNQGVKFYQSEGNRRIVVVDYSPLSFGVYDTVLCYLSPPEAGNENVRDIHYDYYGSLAGRCILWAANRMPDIRLTGWENLSAQVDTKTGVANLGVLSVEPQASIPAGVVAEMVIRDADDGTVENRVSLAIPRNGRLALTLEQLKSGGYYADIILRDAAGRTLDWGSRYFTCASGAAIASINTGQKSYQPDQPVPVDILLEGNLAGTELTVEVVDTYGRRVWSSTVAAKPRISLQADISCVLTVQCEIQATLRKAGTVLAKQSAKVLVLQPHPEPDQYLYAAWASTDHSFVNRQSASIMAAQGITTGVLSGDRDDWANLNVRPTPYMTRYYPSNTEKGLVIRKPCLTDPVFWEEETAKLKANTEKYRHYSPPVYSLGDDQAMMLSYQDGCISPTCLVAFRQYLARQYGSIKALNSSWGASYASFGQVMPLSLQDALVAKQYPAWADHRMYMDELFVTTHRNAKSIIRSIDPDARVGFEGPLLDNSWYGYAWPELLKEMDLMVPYPNAWKFDIVRSFAQPGLTFGGWYGGYAMYRNSEDTPFYPWYLLFNGCNSYWFFCDYGNSSYGHPAQGVAPDLRVLGCLRDTTANVQRIQQGIDRLVLGAERGTDRVAIYFSRPSQHAATLMPAIPTRDFNTDPAWPNYLSEPTEKWSLNTEATLRLLDDIGLSYVFVDRADIAAGALQKNGFRLLVMPFVHAISPQEAKEIENFTAAGGAVLADIRPGLFDQHVKLLAGGQLDKLFGIKRSGSALEPLRDEMVLLSAKEGGKNTGVPMPVDTTVAVRGGKPLAVTDTGVPVFISNIYGKGRTCLMNMSVQHYLTLRAAGRQESIRNPLTSWLAAAGVIPEVQVQAVDNHTAPLRVFHYRDGNARLVGLLRSHKRLMDEPEAFIDRSPRRFMLHFPEIGHIYDVINRTYYGEKDRLEIEIPVATPFLFARLPYRVTGITATINQYGKTVTILPAVQVSQGQPGRHVINVQVTDAKGRKRPEYGKSVVATNGQASHAFNLALNDPEGQWVIEMEDVATGTTARASIQIQLPVSEAADLQN